MSRGWIVALMLMAVSHAFADEPAVRTMRVPDGGIQPQVLVDSGGAVHMVYFKGEAAHGDLYYVRSSDGGKTFSRPIRVNSTPGSSIAIGTIRGAQMAIGKTNRVHVAWNGSSLALPKAAGETSPMLYARLSDAGDAFEPERNLITQHAGLDGGGSVAADADGNVYVAWHAPEAMGQTEVDRRVWVARSADEGVNFAPETQAFADLTGACGCCGMKLFAGQNGTIFALYRSATEKIHRDIYLLRSDDHAKSFTGAKIAPMDMNMCVMSSSAMASTSALTAAAWETQGQIYWAKTEESGAAVSKPIAAPSDTRGRKHPALAIDPNGDVLLAWTEGTGWNKGGSIAWRIFDAAGKPREAANGKAAGLPAWGLPAAFVNGDGGFTIIY